MTLFSAAIPGSARAILATLLLLPLVLPEISLGSQIPERAKKIIDQLPEKALTLDLIVGQALQHADGFKAILADKHSIPAPYLESLSPLDPRLEFFGERMDNRNDSAGTLTTDFTKTTEFSLGLNKYFSTGTETSARLIYRNFHTQASFSGASFITQYQEAAGELKIKQRLWRDAFGSSTRAQIKAGELMTRFNADQFQDTLEARVEDLIKLYYTAWELKNKTRASKESFNRQSRLLKITKIKKNRGTAVQADVYQIENSWTKTNLAYSNAKNALQQIWRELIASVKLPMDWAEIDVNFIPIHIDQPIAQAEKACGTIQSLNPPPKESSKTRAAKFRAEAASLKEKAAQSNRNPDLFLEGKLISNGQDRTNIGIALGEFGTSQHPAWVVKVGISIPLAGFSSRAALFKATAEKEKSEALSRVEKTGHELKWINTCRDFFRLQNTSPLLEKTYLNQKKRVKIEEKRFRIGRISTLNVIAAGNDATEAETRHLTLKKDIRTLAWKILRMTGEMKLIIENFTQQKINIQISKEATVSAR